MMHRHASEIRNSRSLGATSRVIFELKPFEISIRGLIGSEPWVGRSTGKMSGNSKLYNSYSLTHFYTTKRMGIARYVQFRVPAHLGGTTSHPWFASN